MVQDRDLEAVLGSASIDVAPLTCGSYIASALAEAEQALDELVAKHYLRQVPVDPVSA